MSYTNTNCFSFILPENIPYKIYIYHINYIRKHWHNYVEIMMVLKGQIDIDICGEISRLTQGDLLIVNRGQAHELISRSDSLLLSVELNLNKFDLSNDETDIMWFKCDSSRDDDSKSYDELRDLLALIVELNSTEASNSLYDNKSYAYSLLKLLTQEFLDPNDEIRPENPQLMSRMGEILTYIDAHYHENLKLSQVARAMYLSVPYLSAQFTRCLKTTFTDYYNSLRLEHAVSLLCSTDDSIESIALSSGYANAQAFCRAFKAKYDVLPSTYKKKRRKESSYATTPGPQTNNFNEPDGYGPKYQDWSVLAQYFPNRKKKVGARSIPLITKISASWPDIVDVFPDNYKRLLGIGSAKEILYAEVQQHLRDIQNEIGFEYIKFHGLLSDDMMVVTRTISEELSFNFRTIDMVFDFLFSINLKPLIQLSFMPLELAKDRSKLIFTQGFNTSQPTDLNEWALLVKSLFLHLIDRYGESVIVSLPVLLWNNADTSVEMFGMQSDLAFFEFYKITYETVKSISGKIRFGGPTITCMDQSSMDWTRRFYRWEREHDIVPDFFCSQLYGVPGVPISMKIDLISGQPDHIRSTQSGEMSLMAGIPSTSDPDYVSNQINFLKLFRDELEMGDRELWVTEWNMTVSHSLLLNDTQFAGCYVVKNILENYNKTTTIGYWSATDFIEEQKLSDELFYGGNGLVTIDGVRKPQFLAYQSLSHLARNILTRGDGYFVSRSDDAITVLLYNYEHYSDMFAENKNYNVNRTNRYTPFIKNEKRLFHLHLTDIPDREILESVEFIVNRENGSAFDHWLSMGAPDSGKLLSVDRTRLNHLKNHAHPLIHSITPRLKFGVLDYDAELEPLEFRLVVIQFRDGKTLSHE